MNHYGIQRVSCMTP